MTAQFPERLTYQREIVALYTEPLCEYLTMSGVQPSFKATYSSLWRRYIGNWEIVQGRMYLVGLEGTLEDGTKASLSTVFPYALVRVLANWYSGTLRIPKGRQLKYVDMGYDSIFEFDLFLEVLRGSVVATRLQRNEVPSLDDDDDDGHVNW